MRLTNSDSHSANAAGSAEKKKDIDAVPQEIEFDRP
jgi:hypothetical protein